jgi:hypothetical protein
MIPKGISHTSVQIPTYEFQKEILVPFRKILVPFRTTKTVILAGHFYWFGRFVFSTEILT